MCNGGVSGERGSVENTFHYLGGNYLWLLFILFASSRGVSYVSASILSVASFSAFDTVVLVPRYSFFMGIHAEMG
jgi:hypothetical protein